MPKPGVQRTEVVVLHCQLEHLFSGVFGKVSEANHLNAS